MNTCNFENNDGRCTGGEDGDPCPACQESFLREARYYASLYRSTPLAERDSKQYQSEMEDSGRSRLT